MLSGDLLTLAELAAADAKQSGQPPGVLSLARVLARRDAEAFEAVFGAGAGAALHGAHLTRSDVPSVQEILEAASDPSVRSVCTCLHERLGDLSGWVSSSTPAGGARAATTHPSGPAAETADARTGSPNATSVAPTSPQVSAPAEAAPEHPMLETLEPISARGTQQAVIREILAQLGRRTPGNPLLLAPSGAGRTSLAHALQGELAVGTSHALEGCRVVRLAIDRLLRGDPVANLNVALNALEEHDVAFVDDLEALLGLATGGFFAQVAMRLRVPLEQPDRRIVLALDDSYLNRLENADVDLLDELVPIELPVLERPDLEAIVTEEAARLAGHHGVELPAEVIRLALVPAPQDSHRAHPGLAIDRLDLACARAGLRGAGSVAEADLGLRATPEIAPLAVEHLRDAVREEVRGQDAALDRAIRRLALTRARLDLRPERPDAVLLLVGPTGVGKTQLARTLCRQLFGDEERLVRLDMSEYADSWAISRLIGPQPGYVGFTEPDAWLTTRIRRQPATVLLLDEIEKAHPTVWNTFLQVFDAGRLTDPRGHVAEFADTVIVMTSNIGSEAFGGAAIGFAPRDEADERSDEQARVLEAVRERMSPELINRLDDIIVFSPLSEEAILEIAHREIDRAVARLTERGYRIELDPAVPELIAVRGYDPHFGARHLQRNVEELLLMPLAGLETRSLRASVRDGELVWTPLQG